MKLLKQAACIAVTIRAFKKNIPTSPWIKFKERTWKQTTVTAANSKDLNIDINNNKKTALLFRARCKIWSDLNEEVKIVSLVKLGPVGWVTPRVHCNHRQVYMCESPEHYYHVRVWGNLLRLCKLIPTICGTIWQHVLWSSLSNRGSILCLSLHFIA